VLVAVVAAPPPRAAEAAAVKQEWVYLGRSVQGRPIFALHRWTPGASKRVLVIGSMHGNETAGHDVTSRLYRWTPPANVSLWIVRTVNPDGVAARRRKNARGVDLNRNFPHNWARIAPPGSANYPGPYAGSEPETRALMAFTKRLQPRMTVIMHQPLYGIDSYAAKRKEIVSDLARYSGFPVKSFACGRVCHGTYTGWHNHNTPGAAVTVEFGWTPTTTQKERMTRAILLTGSRR
jgi:predicted deacylase